MADKPPKVDRDDEVAEAREAFTAAADAHADNRQAALDDFRFARLEEQWPPQIEQQRRDEGRPCLTINRLPAFIRQVVNDARQNKPSITVHPVDSAADPETAEVFNGLVRHIEQSSDAEVAYDTALECAVTGGFGYFRINTRYSCDDNFEQDLVIERLANPFSVYGDPASVAADSSDWNLAFVLDSIGKKAFERRWDGAEPASFEGDGVQATFSDADNVTIAEWWTRREVERLIVALSAPGADPTGEQEQALQALGVPEHGVIGLDVYEANKALFDAIGVSIVGRPRPVMSYKVTQRLVSGKEVLETVDWAGKFIPIVPVYGEELNVEGKRYLRSLVRGAKDAQRMFNYWRTASTELVALAPKAPFIGPKGFAETDAAKWATANVQSHSYIEYDVIAGGTPPQRQPFAGVPAGALQEALNASDDMKSIMGLHDASLGARSNETSGRAIMARQREGDVSTFHYIDNLSRAIRHAGRILIDLIPKVYAAPRIVRIIGPQDEVATVAVGPKDAPGMPAQIQAFLGQQQQQAEQAGEEAKLARIYDLGAGKYDLTVRAGPSFTSRREEAATQMVELIRAYPAAAPVLGDLLAKNLDWPGADEIAERMKAMLPPQLQGQNPQLEQAKQVMARMGQALQAAKAENEQLKAGKALEARSVEIDAYEAETKRLAAVAGKDGVGFSPEQMAAVQQMVLQTVMQLANDPDLLTGGASPMGDMSPPDSGPLAA